MRPSPFRILRSLGGFNITTPSMDRTPMQMASGNVVCLPANNWRVHQCVRLCDTCNDMCGMCVVSNSSCRVQYLGNSGEVIHSSWPRLDSAQRSESYQEIIEALAFYFRPHLRVELISVKPKCSVEHFRESWLAR